MEGKTKKTYPKEIFQFSEIEWLLIYSTTIEINSIFLKRIFLPDYQIYYSNFLISMILKNTLFQAGIDLALHSKNE